MKPLAVRQVTLTHFRNYTSAQFSFGEKFNLISGLNGLGKTNLLDSIYYLSVGKSYFTPYDQRVVLAGESFFRLEANLMKGDESHTILMKVKPGINKDILVDHVAVNKVSEHLGFIPIVFSAPRDIELVTGASLARRRYLDHLLCQVDVTYLKALMDYNYLLQLRNAALKSGFADLRRIMMTYDEQMAPMAKLIFEKRKWLTALLKLLLQQTYSSLSDDRESIDCIYESQLHEFTYDVLADRNWEADKNTQRTNGGIHKDDFQLLIKSMSAKEFGSQGQIKSLIFSMHLTKYALLRDQKGYYPVLILDDVFDKLDDRRLSRLMEILNTDDFGQIFISDTNRERLSQEMKSALFTEILL
jgi:DNA replication and repair protein RecF